MQFKDIIGNDELKQRLTSFVANNRLPHSLMLTQSGNFGAFALATALIQYLYCPNSNGTDSCGVCSECNKIQKLIHPDIHFVFPIKNESQKKITSDLFVKNWKEKVVSNPYFTEEEHNKIVGIDDKSGVITVNEAASILTKMSTKSYQGGNKCIIILYPEKITTEAANKLLKILEEPYPDSYFIFISQSPEKVIKTIRSRCLILNLSPQELPFLNSSNNDSTYLELIQNIFNNCYKPDLSSLIKMNDKLAGLGREKQKDLCTYFEELLRKVLMVQKGLPKLCSLKENENGLITFLSQKLSEKDITRLFNHIENARTGLESNVNAKMIFLNLNNLIYLVCNS